jgi:YegS/Rv2252/BmrU family lipid kinase
MKAEPRMLVVVNKTAANARRVWPTITDSLKRANIEFGVHETTETGDATKAVRAALREGVDLIAVAGGDGTISEAAAGFFAIDADEKNDGLPSPINHNAVLAALPAGTGDDFARGLTGRREPLNHWIDKLIGFCKGASDVVPRIVDVLYGTATGASDVNRFIALNVVTIGLGAEVAGRVGAQGRMMQKLPGEARFVAAALGALAAWKEQPVRIVVDDDEVIECDSNLLAVANGTFAGGGMMFAPEAEVDDGFFDLLVSRDLSRATILRELPRIRSGLHISNPKVRVLKGKKVTITTTAGALPVEADGNVRGATPAEFRIVPAALRVLV